MPYSKTVGSIKIIMFVFGVIGMMAVGYSLGRFNQSSDQHSAVGVAIDQGATGSIHAGVPMNAGAPVPVKSGLPINLMADTAASGEQLSFATGIIDINLEGLFVLDHLTGTLQCWVVNPRGGGVAGIYSTNVGAALATEKEGKADYVIATGTMDFSGMQRIGNLRPANCVVYVGEGNSGKVVGYSLFFNRTAMLAGRAQGGQLQQVCIGQTRGAGLQRDD